MTRIIRKGVQCSLLATWILGAATVAAHPGWGIVVDANGDLLFTDVARTTIWKFRPPGSLEPLIEDSWTHSLQLDEKGQLFWGREEYRDGRGPYNSFWKLTGDGKREQLIPPTLNRDWQFGTQGVVDPSGKIYFPSPKGIQRRDLQGAMELFVPNISSAMMTMKLGPGDSIYFTDGETLMRVLIETGEVMRVATELLTTPPDDPYFSNGAFNDLLGFDVASDGTAYIAYMGNRRVLRVDVNGQSREIYHALAPWAPVGVVSHEDELYILETSFAEGQGLGGPRIRRRLDDGRFETLVNLDDRD